jgi:hypothetical protein
LRNTVLKVLYKISNSALPKKELKLELEWPSLEFLRVKSKIKVHKSKIKMELDEKKYLYLLLYAILVLVSV